MSNLKEISLFAGTHNEQSSLLILDLMKQKNLKKQRHKIFGLHSSTE